MNHKIRSLAKYYLLSKEALNLANESFLSLIYIVMKMRDHISNEAFEL